MLWKKYLTFLLLLFDIDFLGYYNSSLICPKIFLILKVLNLFILK